MSFSLLLIHFFSAVLNTRRTNISFLQVQFHTAHNVISPEPFFQQNGVFYCMKISELGLHFDKAILFDRKRRVSFFSKFCLRGKEEKSHSKGSNSDALTREALKKAKDNVVNKVDFVAFYENMREDFNTISQRFFPDATNNNLLRFSDFLIRIQLA